MPYLLEKDQNNIKCHGLIELEDYYSQLKAEEFAGALNYLNFVLIKKWIKEHGKKYWIFALFIGTLVCCILEVYRRLVAPYEDSKIADNGDVE